MSKSACILGIGYAAFNLGRYSAAFSGSTAAWVALIASALLLIVSAGDLLYGELGPATSVAPAQAAVFCKSWIRDGRKLSIGERAGAAIAALVGFGVVYLAVSMIVKMIE